MLEAIFTTGVDEIKVSGLYQWDRGQMLQITCPDLPSAFQVHFAKRKSKTSISVQAESADNVAVVAIPDELLQDRFDLYAFLYFDEGVIGETVKTIRMPIKARVKPDDYIIDLPQEQATDAEKIVIKLMDEYIGKEMEAATTAGESAAAAEASALLAANAATEAKEAAVRQPIIQNGTWWVWNTEQNSYVDTAITAQGPAGADGKDGADGSNGQDGNSIQSITRTSGNGAAGTTDTYTVTMTDGSTHTFQVYNGKDGEGSGDMSKSVYDPQNKATDIFQYVDDKLADIDVDVTADEVTFADGETFQQKYDSGELTGPAGKDGEDGSPGADGNPGADGVSPTVSVETITGGHRITITDANGTKTVDVMDGNNSAPSSMGAASYALTASAWAQDSDGLYAQTISVAGVTTDAEQVIVVDVQQTGTDIEADNEALAAWAGEEGSGPASWYVGQGSGTLTFHAKEAPTVNIPLNIAVGVS